ncbi:MAG: hypothetical protein ACI7YS_05190 [Flavobacterium sp.]
MKKLLIILVLGFSLTTFAQENGKKHNQEKTEKMTPEQRQKRHLDKLTKELNLDANQQTQVAAILKEKSDKMHEMKGKKEAQKASDGQWSKKEKKEIKKEMKSESADMDAKMKAVLNPDQYEKWVSMKKENKEKMKKHHKKTKNQEKKDMK